MSEFHVEVVRLGKIEKHPNADTLSITTVNNGYPVIPRTGDFSEGELAVYVPVDSLVPVENPLFAFLQRVDTPRRYERIKAKRLRGIFSMGLLVRADPAWVLGQDVQELLGIEKYEPPDPVSFGGENEKDPGFLPVYTDIEGLRKYSHLLMPGEQVVITEKLHGANGRWLWQDDRLWVGSHKCIKRRDPDNLWWKAAELHDLERKLATKPGIAFYGEVYGQVQDLKYGAKRNELKIAFFDAMNITTRKYLDHGDFLQLLATVELPGVPILHYGAWHEDLRVLAEGTSTLADHVREGFVVKPLVERYTPEIGRVILKLVGEGYMLRKEKST